jgi:hypothetical protein
VQTVIASGHDVPTSAPLTPEDVQSSLQALEARLREQDLAWSDVDLLWLSNSKLLAGADEAETRSFQDISERAIVTALTDFAGERAWFPSLIGSTVRASFFSCGSESQKDISNGLLWVAVTGAAASPVPVGVDVSTSPESRKLAGANALEAALSSAEAYFDAHPEQRPDDDRGALAENSLGLVLTSGSGHVESKVAIDFKECYAVGQFLQQSALPLYVRLSGGCASNRSADQSQTIYFSRPQDGGTTYYFTISHAAVVAILPYASALFHLEHPYKKMSEERLNLDFHEHDMYEVGRYFCVRAINGSTPSDYLRANGWDITDEELTAMVDNHVAIPTEPRAHKVSIASAPPDAEASLWPNVPVWFERVDDEVILRLVRAEAQDSDFFLVRMETNDLVDNARGLANAAKQSRELSRNLIAFLCESRKYVLEEEGRNDEAEALVAGAGTNTVVGVYLNGEYSAGDFRSIGYHNYSQIGVMLTD